jgi:branched-chain amino acid transport system permease protein
MGRFIELVAVGIEQGCIIGLLAIGMVLLYKATRVVNFAHGDLLTLGAYVGAYLTSRVHMAIAPAYLATLAILFVVGVLIERIGYTRLRNQPLLTIVISTFALGLALQAVIVRWLEKVPPILPAPAGNGLLHFHGAVIPYQNIAIIVVTFVLVGGLMVGMQRTALGRQVRALAADREAAMLQGIHVERVSMLMFGLSAALAAVAGLMVAPTIDLTPTLGFGLLINAFPAVFIGGFDRLDITLAAAIVIGVLQALYNINPFFILLVAMVVRPQGIWREPGTR